MNLHCSLTQEKLLRKKCQDVESWVYHFDTGSIFLGLNPLFMAHKLVKNYKEMVKIAITMMYLEISTPKTFKGVEMIQEALAKLKVMQN